MDARLFKLIGCKAMVPYLDAEDQGGTGGDGEGQEDGGDGDGEDGDDNEGDDPDADGDGDGDGEDDGEGDTEDDGEDPEGEDKPEDEDKDLAGLSQRTQKRIRRLVGENKDLARKLEEARKLGGKDGEAIVSAATKAGIMPRLMTKELADGMAELNEKKDVLAYFQNLLDGDDDDFTIGGKDYTRRQLERKEQRLKEEIREVEARVSPGRDKAIAEAKELFELGLAAKKAGWKPGAGGKVKTNKKLDGPVAKAKVGHKKANARRDVKEEDVVDDDSLEAYIAAQSRKAR